mmetsp:Transcript_20035/g.47757  ORF Transcript_20035/g.47757 Transcript_20035/m.47757 type:complete len:253 (-) Transcript_20035:315-1073(-)
MFGCWCPYASWMSASNASKSATLMCSGTVFIAQTTEGSDRNSIFHTIPLPPTASRWFSCAADGSRDSDPSCSTLWKSVSVRRIPLRRMPRRVWWLLRNISLPSGIGVCMRLETLSSSCAGDSGMKTPSDWSSATSAMSENSWPGVMAWRSSGRWERLKEDTQASGPSMTRRSVPDERSRFISAGWSFAALLSRLSPPRTCCFFAAWRAWLSAIDFSIAALSRVPSLRLARKSSIPFTLEAMNVLPCFHDPPC